MPSYKYKNAVTKKIGEFKCPYCPKVFHIASSLAGHIGGAHRRFTTATEKPQCKFCDEKLIPQTKETPKGNWPQWAIEQQNLICFKCKRIQNRKSYRNKMKRRKEKK